MEALRRKAGVADLEVWEWLVAAIDAIDPAYTRGAIHGGQAGENEWLKEAERLLAIVRSYPKAGRRSPPPRGARTVNEEEFPKPEIGSAVRGDEPLPLLDGEARRALAFSVGLANRVARDANVRAFRRRVLGDVLLTETQVRAFRASVALGVLAIEQVEAAKIPVVGHRVDAVGGQSGGVDGRSLTFRVDPPGAIITSELGDSTEQPVPRGGVWRGAEAWPGSVLGWLRTLSQSLARHYGWTEWEASAFVLAGSVPFISPLTMRATMAEHGRVSSHASFRRGQITLVVDPWVSADAVRAAYRETQARLREGSDPRGRRSRPQTEKTLDVFLFAERRRDASGNLPPFRDLAREWNDAEPDHRFDNLDKFRGVYKRAEDAIMNARGYRIDPPSEEDARDSSLFVHRAVT